MPDTLQKNLLLALRDGLSREEPEIAVGIGQGADKVYFSFSQAAEAGMLLRISALTTDAKEGEEWSHALGEVFSVAIALVSDVMQRANLSFQTDEGDVTRILARRGRYISSASFGEAVWLRAADFRSGEGMRAASQEEILLHGDDMPRIREALEEWIQSLPEN